MDHLVGSGPGQGVLAGHDGADVARAPWREYSSSHVIAQVGTISANGRTAVSDMIGRTLSLSMSAASK
jgi:hypothetical protein